MIARILFAGLLFLAPLTSAVADQVPKAPTDQAIQQARETMFQAEAQYFLMLSQYQQGQAQSQALAGAVKKSEEDRYWAEVWRALVERDHPKTKGN